MRSAVLRNRDTGAATGVAWAMNWIDPDRAAYVTIQLLRGVFMVAAFPAGAIRRNHVHLSPSAVEVMA